MIIPSLEEVRRERMKRAAEKSLLEFSRQAWHIIEPRTFSENWHLAVIAEHLEALRAREIDNLLINIPPGTMKSLMVSVMFPAWVWAKDQSARFLGASYGADLAIRDAQKSRDIITSEWFRAQWPAVEIREGADQKIKYELTGGGWRIATSVGGRATGEHPNYKIVDDPTNAKQADSDAERETANEFFDRTLTSRGKALNAQTIVVMQRLHQKDLTGHILSKKLGYEHLCIPMEYDGVKRKTFLGAYDPRTKIGELLWSELFPAKAVEELKEGLGTYATAGQLQQAPAPEGGGLIDTESFNLWPHDKPLPQFLFVVQGYDTAFTEKTSNDPTAMQAWGVFEHKGKRHVMLLDCWADRMKYPELRERVIDEWAATYGKTDHTAMTKVKKADIVLIENKGSGQALINDLYSANVFVSSYDLPRGQRAELSKVSRVHLITHIIDAGRVWLLESSKQPGKPVTWARNYVAECAVFPKGEHDDQVDVTSMTLYYLKDHGWFDLQAAPDDEVEEADYTKKVINPYAA